MAAAGPIASILLAAATYGVYLVGKGAGWPEPPIAVARYLGLINGLLAAFNLIPGFPLDGGRLLRSVLWVWKQNLRWATRITSQIGAGFGLLLIFLGILHMLRGEFAGLWWLLIGLFLRDAATTSYQQLLLRKGLEGEAVRRFMISEPVTVPASSSIEELVEGYIYRHHFKMYPVVEDGRLLGCVTIRQVKAIPRNEWKRHTVGEVATPCSPENTLHPEDDAMKALSTMSRTGASRLMVVEGNRLVGIIALKDMLGLLSLKVELEEPEA
jgi:CBS domain-containing protein